MPTFSSDLVALTNPLAQIEASEPNLPKISKSLVNIANMLPAGPNIGVTIPTAPVIPAPPAEFTKYFSKLPTPPDIAVPAKIGAKADYQIIPDNRVSYDIPGKSKVVYAGNGNSVFNFK